jgi:hypothetical protein
LLSEVNQKLEQRQRLQEKLKDCGLREDTSTDAPLVSDIKRRISEMESEIRNRLRRPGDVKADFVADTIHTMYVTAFDLGQPSILKHAEACIGVILHDCKGKTGLGLQEIGTVLEAEAAQTIAQRGVQLIATAHGHALDNVLKNPSLVGLVGGVEAVTLGDEEAKRRGGSKSVLERQGPPTFTVAVEMLAIGRWRVHLDVASAVDALLSGRAPPTQLRRCAKDGTVIVEDEFGGAIDDAPDARAATPAAPGAVPSMPAGSPVGAGSRPSAPGPPAVRLFCHGIDTEALARVVAALGMRHAVVVTSELEEADAVLALRSRLGRAGADDWLRITARQRGVPLYAIKTDTLSQLVRALKTILGAPAQGAADAVAALEEAEAAALPAGAKPGRGASPVEAAEALEEARLAVERIVIPQATPVELLPRPPHIRAAQEALVASYRLTSAVAGAGSAARLRILPEYTKAAPVETSR